MKKYFQLILALVYLCVGCDQVKLSEIKTTNSIATIPRGNNPNADKILVYVIESPVINWQLDYSASPNDVPDFKHLDVLRGELSFVKSNLLDSSVTNETLKDSIQSKKVLLEYFTGHKCGNCPSQSKSAFTNIESTFSTKVKVIKIHAGFFAEPKSASSSKYTYDFRNSIGNSLYDKYGVTSVPIGMVDRKEFAGLSTLLSPSAWLSQIDLELKQKPNYGIWEKHSYNSESKRITLNATIKDQNSGKIYAVDFYGILGTDWKSENCSLVMVVESTAQKRIEQVQQVKLIP
jgi:hypothetical protein